MLFVADDYYYTLRDVIFFLENNEIGVGEYRRLCAEKKITAVVEQDKQSLKSYLLGEVDTCPQIDLSMLSSSSATTSATSAVSLDTQITQSASSSSTTGQHKSSTSTTQLPAISEKELQEKRQRHAELIDQAIQRPSILSNIHETTSGNNSGDVNNRAAPNMRYF